MGVATIINLMVLKGQLLGIRADRLPERDKGPDCGATLRMLTVISPVDVSRERYGLRHLFERLRQQTRWQINARVLPVVFLAVMLVGAFGWLVFTRYTTGNLVDQDSQEVTFLMDNLRQKALVETMGLEARKALVDVAADSDKHPDDETMCRDWTSDMIRVENLVGMARVGLEQGDEHDNPSHLQSLCFVDSLSGPVNDSRMHTWFEANHEYFCREFQSTGWSGVHVLDAPVLAYDNPWHSIYVFPPVLIEEVRGGSQASAVGELAALLPVLVRDEQDKTTPIFHTVYFLSLNRMLAELLGSEGLVSAPDTWWCVLNHQGRVIAAAESVPTVGSLLQNQHRTANRGPFAVASGEELLGDWSLGEPWPRSLFGGRLAPWVVTAGQSQDFPLAILIGYEARELRTTSLGYMFAVIGMALLALAIAVFGVTRVVGKVSTRLTTLSHNMKQVAAGDYSRRIPTSARDEVGRLINYFNLMAVSLDETKSQLTEKTKHLQAALENRQLLDRAKDDFLELISHEVRTPLTAIMGGVNILKSVVDRTIGTDLEVLEKLNVIEVVKIIEASGDRLHGFMNDAIQMTSIQSSDKEIDLKITPVGDLVELGLCGLREMAKVRDIEVVNGLDNERNWQVLCDTKIMKLAFEKVLKNAVVHNYEKGRVVIREVEEVPGLGRIAEMPRAEDIHRLMSLRSFEPFEEFPINWRIIEIFNTGDAIPPDRCGALFGKFELVGRIEHHQRGSGLSLPIAQSAVESHGGRICVHSAKLQGNSFYLLLPTVATVDVEAYRARADAEGRSLLSDPVGEQLGYGVDGGSSDEFVDLVGDLAGLEVEFDNQGPALTGGGNQPGGGVDRARGANDQKNLTGGRRAR